MKNQKLTKLSVIKLLLAGSLVATTNAV